MRECDPRLLALITDAIGKAYGSIEDANWRKINEHRNREPYGGLLRNLAQEWEIQDTSDENYDVCLDLNLSPRRSLLYRLLSLKKPFPRYSLLLSFVGPFAVLLDYVSGRCVVVSPDQKEADGSDRILAELRSHSISSLGAPELEHSFPLPGLCEPSTGTVFHVLFENCNCGGLRWKYDAESRHAEPLYGL